MFGLTSVEKGHGMLESRLRCALGPVLLAVVIALSTLNSGCVQREYQLTYVASRVAPVGNIPVHIEPVHVAENIQRAEDGGIFVWTDQEKSSPRLYGDIGKWIEGALRSELRVHGFEVQSIKRLTPDSERGIRITVTELRFVVDFGTIWSPMRVAAVLSYGVEIWRRGEKRAVLAAEGIGEIHESAWGSTSPPYDLAAGAALRNSLVALLPKIIEYLK